MFNNRVVYCQNCVTLASAISVDVSRNFEYRETSLKSLGWKSVLRNPQGGT